MNTLATQTKDTTLAQDALSRARTAAGGNSALARKMGEYGLPLTRQAVFFWTRVPLKYVRTVAKITGIPVQDFLPESN